MVSIAIEGTVGSGKSTLSKVIADKLGFTLVEEQFVNPYFDDFYKLPKDHAFPMHVQMLRQHFNLIRKCSDQNTILDRTLWAGTNFMGVLHNQGVINSTDYQNYLDFVDTFASLVSPPDLMVYLDVSKHTSIERIMKRNRESELHASINYWYDLCDEYDKWFENYNKSPKIKINADQLNFINNYKDIESIIDKIKNELVANKVV